MSSVQISFPTRNQVATMCPIDHSGQHPCLRHVHPGCLEGCLGRAEHANKREARQRRQLHGVHSAAVEAEENAVEHGRTKPVGTAVRGEVARGEVASASKKKWLRRNVYSSN